MLSLYFILVVLVKTGRLVPLKDIQCAVNDFQHGGHRSCHQAPPVRRLQRQALLLLLRSLSRRVQEQPGEVCSALEHPDPDFQIVTGQLSVHFSENPTPRCRFVPGFVCEE